MREGDPGARLRSAVPPGGEEARRRAWAVTAEAFAERAPSPRRRPRAAIAVALALAAGFAGAASPPGEAVADWVRRIVNEPDARSRPAPAPSVRLAAPGRVLVTGPDGLQLVARQGVERRLGRWRGAAWSPRGRFLVAWRGTKLAALSPAGRRAWTLAAPAALRAAAWSPEGFHVAYLAGTSLRVASGDGRHDRLLRARVRPVAPAFRPDARRTLAWVEATGRVSVLDVFSGVRRARSGARLGREARGLAWSGDGRVLAVRARDGLRLWDTRSGRVRSVALEGRPTALAAGPVDAAGGAAARRFAVVLRDERRRVGELALVGARGGVSTLVRVRGVLSDAAFSPRGRRLLVAWPSGRRWLLLSPERRVVEAAAPAGARPGRIAGWCCADARGAGPAGPARP